MSAPVEVYWLKRIDNSRLVRQRDPRAWRDTAALLAGAVLGGAILLLCAWQHFAYVHAGYQLEELQAQHERVLDWNRTLHLEQAALLDPMRIDVLARSRLGLAVPAAGQMIPLGTGEGGAPAAVLARAKPEVTRPATRVSLAD